MSADRQVDGLGHRFSGGILNGESVSGGFPGGDVEAAGVGGPDVAGGRIKRDGFGVGDVVAELRGFSRADGAR